MKIKTLIPVLAMLLIASACMNGQSGTGGFKLSATAFAQKIKEQPTATVIDVRTPDEFSKGHIEHAKNVDWNGDAFDKGLEGLDKAKPVYVYCLGGGRSAEAAAQMRSNGFKEVYELDGGMMQWRANHLPETTQDAPQAAGKPGLTQAQFEAMLAGDKPVLVDFSATWCGPCKKMKPYIEALAENKKDNLKVINIDADENPDICSTYKIEGLPTLILFRNKQIVWKNLGYMEKNTLFATIDSLQQK